MHKCLRCGKLINTMEEVDKGCPCGSKVFLFQQDGGEAERQEIPDAQWIEKELVKKFPDDGKSIVLDLENVRIREKGIFEINLHSLLQKEPLVVKDANGVYYVKLP
ncbi:hypothetical protein COV61_04010 [Candidatus Micrarchaeota archaeon CG11_big_fil_rev_8_21_14_0_20_47_5]|nr:MAG: hypothetical protein AUJ17_01785 [Candidatus Micrarchaeota archaeon CG1_02_47_40]PIN83121.1 MAG: hypothetical protein COV61_04010 [Candidatus Micrarchaeota archaeon CG11_big_fil_rev_8_21_14_0_20_47_5]